MKIGVVLVAEVQTGYDIYTNIHKTVYIDIPDDGKDWHVSGEEYREAKANGKTD